MLSGVLAPGRPLRFVQDGGWLGESLPTEPEEKRESPKRKTVSSAEATALTRLDRAMSDPCLT